MPGFRKPSRRNSVNPFKEGFIKDDRKRGIIRKFKRPFHHRIGASAAGVVHPFQLGCIMVDLGTVPAQKKRHQSIYIGGIIHACHAVELRHDLKRHRRRINR